MSSAASYPSKSSAQYLSYFVLISASDPEHRKVYSYRSTSLAPSKVVAVA